MPTCGRLSIGLLLDNESTPMRQKHFSLFSLAAVVLVAVAVILAPARAQRLITGEIEIRQALERLLHARQRDDDRRASGRRQGSGSGVSAREAATCARRIFR